MENKLHRCPTRCSLAPSLPRSLAPSLPRSLAPSLPRSLAPSLPRSLAPSLPRSFDWSVCGLAIADNVMKGSRPMTYQYLTVDMIATAKEKKSFCTSQWVPGENVRRPGPLLLPLITPMSVVLVAASANEESDFKAISENV